MNTPEIYRTEKSRDILLDFYDSVLRQWTFPYETADIPTRHGTTRIVTAGDRKKPALTLLHGAASNILGWGAAIPEYMRDYFVIAPDIPGEAGPSEPIRPSWDNADYVEWLEDVLASIDVGRTALLGLSFGGWIAAKYAAARPERAERLVLLAPGGIAPARTSTIVKTILYASQKQKGAEKMTRLVFGSGDIPPEVGYFFDLLQLHYAPRFGSPPLLLDDEIRRIACPVLMMTGGEDAFFDADRSGKRLKKLLPRAEIRIDAAGEHGITQYGGGIAGFLAGH